MHKKRLSFDPNTFSHAAHRYIWSLWLCGAITTVAGFAGVFVPGLAVLLLVPLAALALVAFSLAGRLSQAALSEKLLTVLLSVTWALHLVQVFVPESGFDALWYHLPVAKVVLENQRFLYDPALYQSLNPLFADSVFFLGFAWQQELGAKLVAYFFGLAVALVTYVLARTQLPRVWSLAVVFVVSTFQVVAWQSSSFYIDIAKAVWELAALVYLLKYVGERSAPTSSGWAGRWLLASGLMLGASLASKVFSIVLLPAFAAFALWGILPPTTSRSKIRNSLRRLSLASGLQLARQIIAPLALLALSALIVALPFYIFAYAHVGSPLGFVDQHVDSLILGESPSTLQYLAGRIAHLPQLPFQLLLARDYLSPLLLLLFPLVVLCRNQIAKDRQLQLLLGFTLAQLLVWWFVPPLSTRYALSGFIVMALLVVYLINMLAKLWRISERKALCAIVAISILMLTPRIFVAHRSLEYLTGQQTQAVYLQQFVDGNIDHAFYGWYGERLKLEKE